MPQPRTVALHGLDGLPFFFILEAFQRADANSGRCPERQRLIIRPEDLRFTLVLAVVLVSLRASRAMASRSAACLAATSWLGGLLVHEFFNTNRSVADGDCNNAQQNNHPRRSRHTNQARHRRSFTPEEVEDNDFFWAAFKQSMANAGHDTTGNAAKIFAFEHNEDFRGKSDTGKILYRGNEVYELPVRRSVCC